VRNELFESVRPTVVLAAFSLEDFRSFNKLRETVRNVCVCARVCLCACV
jgi:hypothetical protein